MDDYIVIILIIAFAILGAITKGKKKQAEHEKSVNSDQAQRPSLFEQFFDDPLFNNEQPVTDVQKPILHEKEKRRAQVHKTKASPVSSVIANEKQPAQPEAKTDQPKERIRNAVRKDFSLKKAVIYSEILNRKY